MVLQEESIRMWHRLGEVSPEKLGDAVQQTHWAVQLVMAFTDAFEWSSLDMNHDNLKWYEDHQALVGHRVPTGFRAGLRISDLSLLILDKDTSIREELCLHGHTLEQSLAWLSVHTRKLTSRLSNDPLTLRDYGVPAHGVSEGKPFSTRDEEAFEELSYWYGNAANALRDVAGSKHSASSVRCWPQHINICTRIVVESDELQNDEKWITVGMNPGDSVFDEPYIYVNPWPCEPDWELPSLLGNGHWYRDSWTGAVLTGRDLVLAYSPEIQARQLSDFLRSAIAANYDLLEISQSAEGSVSS